MSDSENSVQYYIQNTSTCNWNAEDKNIIYYN